MFLCRLAKYPVIINQSFEYKIVLMKEHLYVFSVSCSVVHIKSFYKIVQC